jgi:ferredoxin
MEKLKSVIKELLTSGKVSLVIGFRNGINNTAIPFFIDNSANIEQMVYDERCRHNLAHFLYKKEVATFQKLAIVTDIRGVKTIIQLLAERQLGNSEISAIIPESDGSVVVLSTVAEFESFAESHQVDQTKEDKEFIEKINAMPREKRWDFWVAKLAECVKCYACRAACPLCYCNRCAIEENRPQWIKISSGAQGNMEWHISHAMHLAGRCVACGECSRACPVGIPVHIFTSMMNKDIEEQFNYKPGMKVKTEYALNTYKPDDKENFIR